MTDENKQIDFSSDEIEEGFTEDEPKSFTRLEIEELIDSRIKEAEAVKIESKLTGVSVELVSRKFNAVQLSNVAMEIFSKMPFQLNRCAYIG